MTVARAELNVEQSVGRRRARLDVAIAVGMAPL